MEAEASSRDLLQRFAGSTALCDSLPPHLAVALVAGGEDVELSLGLSLGGCFSSNPREKANKLIRSSSISSFPFLDSKDENFPVAPTPLHRTCSLPVLGNDEDYRKRKELQTRKRLEAKRKRSEKRNSSRGEEGSWLPPRPPTSQRSIGSVASSSSGGGSMQGFDIVRVSNCSEAKSSLPDHTSPRPSANDNTLRKLGRRHSGMGNMERSSLPDHTARGLSAKENTLKKLGRRHSGMGETESDVMKTSTKEEMPCVSTQGNGPNGKRIEGFLYKYRNGEELRIVCVCHGSFLTPSEFVRHAGGGDVDHPLRHIVVNPLSPLL